LSSEANKAKERFRSPLHVGMVVRRCSVRLYFVFHFLSVLGSIVLSTYSVVLFAIACLLNSGSAPRSQSGAVTLPRHESIAPEWRTDLRSAIRGARLGEIFGQGREYKAFPRTSLWFIDNRTIIATVLIRDANPGLSGRNSSDPNASLRLRPVLLDAISGKVMATPEWLSNSRNAGIITVHEGKAVTQVGNELTLYGSDLKPLKTLKLPSVPEGDWIAHPSPTGKTILFLPPGHRTGLWLRLDTETLGVRDSWEDTQNGDVAASDDQIAMVSCTWSHDCKPAVEIRSVATGWQAIAMGYPQSYPQFVDEDLLFLSGKPSSLIHTDGQIVFTDDLPFQRCWWGRPIPAAGSQRFIVPACAVKGAAAPLDISGHEVLKKILVHDDLSNAWSYIIDVKGSTIKGLTLLAVSPDGLHLAVLAKDSVQVFSLPSLQ
jgi:hypothetical protein